MKTRYGFIGAGSMGSMLIRKFIDAGCIPPLAIAASSRNGISARALADETGITAADSNRAVAENADILFICVKPLEVQGVLAELRDLLGPDTLLVSIAGSVTLENLGNWAGTGVRLVRVIPSVTAEENAGISLIVWGGNLHPADKEIVRELFNSVSTAVETDETDLDLFTDLTSCGPALIACMMQEFAATAVRAGTARPEFAEFLVRETMIGTARILAGDRAGFSQVIGRVATKGGSTEEGVKILQERLPTVMDEVIRALDEKRKRTAEKIAAGK